MKKAANSHLCPSPPPDASEGASIAFQHGAFTLKGAHERNEDAFLMDGGRGLWAVADGVGGASHGDVMSLACCRAAPSSWDSLCAHSADPETRLAKAMVMIDARANALSALLGGEGSGATMAMAALCGSRMYLASVGDCRAYVLRHATLRPLMSCGRRRISSSAPDAACGWGMDPAPRISSISVEAGDVVMLCTDGVWATQPAHRMEESLSGFALTLGDEGARHLARRVVQSSDLSDDATAVVIAFGE